MNIIFDGNYLFHVGFAVFTQYHRGKDMREVLSDKDNKQVLMRKLVIDMCSCINRFKKIDQVTFVIDSMSWRYGMYPDYKYALTRVRGEDYDLFLECLNMFEKLLRSRKLIVSRIEGAEGDDLIYAWKEYFGVVLNEPTVIITGDSDIRQLITEKVSVFCNNSKILRYYVLDDVGAMECFKDTEGITVEKVDPVRLVIKKIILGDKSDNILNLKRGFGEKAFDKFYDSFNWDNIEISCFANFCNNIYRRFVAFTQDNDRDYLKRIKFNAKLVWLSFEALQYSGILEELFEEVNARKNTYGYKKKFTLEDFYGMLIK